MLAVLGAAESLAFMDGLIVSVALPAIRQTFGFSPGQLQWVINAYVVLMGGTLLVGGRLGDIFGRRRALVGGLTLFGIGALLGGLAPWGAVLLLARGLQGVGAGSMLSASLALVTATFVEGRPRQRALGVLAVLSGIAAVIGVVLGGMLTGWVGWRWVLLINAPLAAITVAAARRLVPASRRDHRMQRIDVVGSVTVTIALLLIVYGIVQAEHGDLIRPAVVVPVAAGAAVAATTMKIEQRAADPVVPLSVFAAPGFVAANLAGMLLPVGLGAVLFLGPLHLQTVLEISAIATGLWLVPMAAAIAVVGPAVPRLVGWLGRRLAAAAGFALQAAGLAGIAAATGSTEAPIVLPVAASVLVGLGAPLAYVPVTTAAMRRAGSRSGTIAGLFNTSQHIGNAVGLAIVAAVVGRLSPSAHGAPGDRLVDGIHIGFVIAACISALGIAPASRLEEAPPQDRGSQRNESLA